MVVLDYLSWRLVYVGKNRKSKKMEIFFTRLSQQQRDCIEAIFIYTEDLFIKAVKKNSQAKIFFYLLHLVAQFKRIIDNVRKSKYHKASEENKAVFKGAKYLLLKNRKKKLSYTQLKQLNNCWN